MTVDYNVIYNKLNLREKKKKKTSCASTLKEEPSKTKDDFDWLENLEVEDDEEALATTRGDTNPTTTIKEHMKHLGSPLGSSEPHDA